AGRALVARLGALAVGAVEGARQDPRGGGLAGAARARKEIGRSNPAQEHALNERPRHLFLAHEVAEPQGPIFQRQRDVTHPSRTTPLSSVIHPSMAPAARMTGRAAPPGSLTGDFCRVAGSGQAPLRHTRSITYRCYLPVLTEFVGSSCARPDLRSHVRGRS